MVALRDFWPVHGSGSELRRMEPSPPQPNKVKNSEKHIKRGYNMLYIGYFILLDGQSIKKISFGNFHF